MNGQCGPGLCHCDEADTCPECGEAKVSCEGLCEDCYIAQQEGEREEEPDDALVHDTWEEHRGER